MMNPPDILGAAVTRRSLLRGALLGAGALAGAGALSGCGRFGTANTQDVQLWHLFTGGDGGAFMEITAAVEAQNPGLAIETTVLSWGGPYYTKLAMASVGGRGPDLAVMHASRLAGYAPGGLIEPWDFDRLAEHGVAEADISPLLKDYCTVGGKQFAIPMDFHPTVLFYNTDVCAEAGVLDADGKLTGVDSAEGFRDVLAKVQKVTGQQGLAYGYNNDGAQVSRIFWTMYKQLGGEIDLVIGRDTDLNLDIAEQAIAYVQGLLDNTLALQTNDGGAAIAQFSTGRAGLLWSGVWEVNTFKKAGLNFDVMPMPKFFDKPGTFGDCHSLILPTHLSRDDARVDRAYQVTAGFLKNSLTWADGGHIPAYTPVTKTPEYAALLPQAHYASAVDAPVFEPTAWFSGSASNLQARMSGAVEPAWLHGGDPAVAAKAVQTALNTLLHATQPA
ncbi:extracellular solute-binding protein [Micrococcales bacterium 31B]|nr:extracellular solute-binding protein [Micrococcales bacterium 31B]